MTSEDRTPIPVTSTGVDVSSVLTTPADTVTFTAAGNRDFLRITNGGSEMTVTVVCTTDCNIGLAKSAHNFVMTIPAVTGDKIYSIPNIQHYIDVTTGKVTMNFSRTSDVRLGIFEVPAYL
jgi:hypothetical protein